MISALWVRAMGYYTSTYSRDQVALHLETRLKIKQDILLKNLYILCAWIVQLAAVSHFKSPRAQRMWQFSEWILGSNKSPGYGLVIFYFVQCWGNKGTEQVFYLRANFIEATVPWLHLHGRNEIDCRSGTVQWTIYWLTYKDSDHYFRRWRPRVPR